jgi:hypothetical protein
MQEIRERREPEDTRICPENPEENHAYRDVDDHRTHQRPEIVDEGYGPEEEPVHHDAATQDYEAIQDQDAPIWKRPLGKIPVNQFPE